MLLRASKPARPLELVDPGAFVERKHPETMLSTEEDREAAAADAREVVVPKIERDLPALPDLPQYGPVRLVRAQRYHLELVAFWEGDSSVLVCGL